MTVDEFFDLFLEELKSNQALWYYYKFLGDPKKLGFRKAYFCQRLQYIIDHIGPVDQRIWDCGCGYGTTALFLAMNGYRVYGSTLEFYFKEIEKRKNYWKQFGDSSLFEAAYEDIYTLDFTNCFDTIILQDTLHHLEPITEALEIFHRSLRKDGKLLVIEENGANLIQNLKLIKQRGFKKIGKLYDETLKKEVLFGNENIRSLSHWRKLLTDKGFSIDDSSVRNIRFLPSSSFVRNYENAIRKEEKIAKQFSLLKEYFYFGINFIVTK